MKTFEELKVTKEEYDALQVVRDNLRAGVFVHGHSDPKNPSRPVFDMNVSCGLFGFGTICGTVGCIGGWVALVMAGKAFVPLEVERPITREDRWAADSYVSDASSEALRELYYPSRGINWHEITPEMAAQAIDNFLNAGDPDWGSVVPYDDEDDDE